MSARIHDTSAIPGGFLVHHSVCWCRKGGEGLEKALTAFREVFTAEDTVRDLAPNMTHGEASVLADLLDELGEGPAADLWRSLTDEDSEVEA